MSTGFVDRNAIAERGLRLTKERPHVALFSFFLALMTSALLLCGAFAYALVFAALLALLLRCALLHLEHAARPRLVAECLALSSCMCISYVAMAGAVPLVHGTLFDPLLFRIDLAFWGTSPSTWTEAYITSMRTDVFSACYFFFLPLLYFSLIRYFFWQKDRLEPFYAGLFTIYGLGFLGYLLVPAVGPYLAYAQAFPVPLQGGPITHVVSALVLNGSNGVDDWPSLHCGASAFILGFAFRHQKTEFWLLLLPVVCLWVSTIYLRYHYSVDDICGFALAPLGLWMAQRFERPARAGARRGQAFEY